MESGPAIFAAVVFALFGTGLLLWTAVRAGRRLPVAAGAHPVIGPALSTFFGAVALAGAVWCLAHV
ncbi:hypothetical protein IHE55_13365 [Streptomyces pactum]|uniref:Uncharacterized protein n=1 Tax=Streptomyces pactum TaxID=68249 RepID=A0ABS0NKU7_9ACTN|nr:hypothetical protein [Streptomyces pactum]MBH5335732.1 hypothetical protein [Streptomyces pactum]